MVIHQIHLEENAKTSREPQRRLNSILKEVVRAEVIKLLDACIIYHISDSQWVSQVQVVPKKSGVTVVTNENNKLVPTLVQTGWRVCIDYRKLNSMTRKDHFPLPFIDQMLERLAEVMLTTPSLMVILNITKSQLLMRTKRKRYSLIRLAYLPTVALPFGLYNALTSFQWCMLSIFSDKVERFLEIFMDDFLGPKAHHFSFDDE